MFLILLGSGAEATGAAAPDESALLFRELPSVFAASKFEQSASAAPASVSVVTAADIERFGWRTLAEVLANVPGFLVTNDRNYSYVGARGFNRPGDYNTRVLGMIDGHRLNEEVFDSLLLGQEGVIDLALVDRVEVIRGPSSSLYGSNAFFGVVNIVTKRGRELGVAEVAIAVGRPAAAEGRATLAGVTREGDWLLSVQGIVLRGETLSFPEFAADPSGGTARDLDGERVRRIFAKYAGREFTAQLGHSARWKAVPTAAFSTVFGLRTYTADERSFANLAWRREWREATELRLRLAADRYAYRGRYPLEKPGMAGPVVIENQDEANAESVGAEFLVVHRAGRHRLTAGLEATRNMRRQMRNYDDAGSYLDIRRSGLRSGFFVQDDLAVNDWLRLNLGLRHDRLDPAGRSTNPRLAAIFTPSPTTTLKLLHGRAFRAPSLYEREYSDGYVSQKPAGNKLGPEKIATTELVWEQAIGADWRSAVSVFHYRLRGLIDAELDADDSLLVYRNLGRVSARGASVELDGRLPGGIDLRSAISWQDARAADDSRLNNSPRWQATWQCAAPLAETGGSLGLSGRLVSARRSEQNTTVAGYGVVDLNLLMAQRLGSPLRWQLTVKNLFDHRYFDSGGGEHVQAQLQQPGRMIWLQAEYRFSR